MTDSTSEIPLKRCTKGDNCVHPDGPWLPATTEFFYRAKENKDGLFGHCRECQKAHVRLYRQQNPDKVHEANANYYYADVERSRARRRKQYAENPQRDYEYSRRYKRENPDKAREWSRRGSRKWRTQHPEKAKASSQRYLKEHSEQSRARNAKWRVLNLNAPGSHTADDIKVMYAAQKGLCWYCGKSVGKKYDVDHRIPLSRGGSNDPSNLCITCPTCNRSKNDKLPHEWSDRLL